MLTKREIGLSECDYFQRTIEAVLIITRLSGWRFLYPNFFHPLR